MRSKDNEFAAVKLPRCLVCGGAKVEWGRHSSEHTRRHIVQAHVEEDRTGPRIPIHVCREGGGGEKQGEKEWWEGDRRERENREKQRAGERRWIKRPKVTVGCESQLWTLPGAV